MRGSMIVTALLASVVVLTLASTAMAAIAPKGGDFSSCPEQGWGGDPALNRLKNRSVQPVASRAMTVAQMNALPMPWEAIRRSRVAWPAQVRAMLIPLEGQGVVVTAFVIGVKQEGPETTNCRRQDLHDYHLWIVDARGDTRATSAVIEMSPRWLAANQGWRLRMFKRMVRQRAQVRITGWLLFDPQHPDQIGRTRGGLWEVHPVTRVEVFTGGVWREL